MKGIMSRRRDKVATTTERCPPHRWAMEPSLLEDLPNGRKGIVDVGVCMDCGAAYRNVRESWDTKRFQHRVSDSYASHWTGGRASGVRVLGDEG